MAEYLEKSKIKQYTKDFCKGLISDDRQFDLVDDALLLCQMIDFAPAADVVEVVRCKDCKRSEKRNGNRYCKYWFDTVDPFHYCSKGERKADNDKL